VIAAAMPANPISPIPRANLIQVFVGVVKEMHIDGQSVCIHGDYIVSQAAVDRSAVLWIVFGALQFG